MSTPNAANAARPRPARPGAPAPGRAQAGAKAKAQALADHSTLLRAVALQNQGATEAAERLFERYLAARPADPVALYSLALIALNDGRSAQALALIERGTAAAPDFADLWALRGKVYEGAERLEEALASYERAATLRPGFVEALICSGVVLRRLMRYEDSILRFDAVLQLQPDHETALGNCGIMLSEYKRTAEAIAMFERLLRVQPDYPNGLGMLAYQRLHACDWSDCEALRDQILQVVRSGRRACTPFALMAIADDLPAQQASARIFGAQYFPPSPQPLWQGERRQHAGQGRRLRVAYVSPDLREHPVGQLMAGILERHDKRRFELVAIATGTDDASPLRQRIVAAFDHFIDARLMGGREIAELMHRMEIDIAVDLGGYTANARPDAFSHRPAPVQVGYLGYPGTMGVPYMDYILADRHVAPATHHAFFDEAVVTLPHCYLPVDDSMRAAERTPTRAECGLPEDGFVFCSFSHDYKISPPVFALWMRLLRQVPGSVLWLTSRAELSCRNLRTSAQAHGVDPARLVFASRVPSIEDHLARYRQADLFLDTHPYNAHTTTADALLAGLPVLTCMGQAFASRVAGSLLHAAGLPELVTADAAQYEALALALATDRPRLAALRARLAANRDSAPLFDTAAMCRHLENAYQQMWERHERGEAAAAFEVPDLGAAPAPALQPGVTPSHLQAGDDVRRGNLQRAEFHCRDLLQQSPEDALALTLLGHVALKVGCFDVAARHYARVLTLTPGAEDVEGYRRAALAADERQRAAQPRSAQPRFLLIKAWGYGFWSDVDHVLGQCLLAHITGRLPVVHWGGNSLFGSQGVDNAFTQFFEPLSGVTLDDLASEPGLRFFPDKWRAATLRDNDLAKFSGPGSRLSGLYLLRRPEEVVVSDFHTRLNDLLPWIDEGSEFFGLEHHTVARRLYGRHMRLRPELQQRIDARAATVLGSERWLAVHARGSDKVYELSDLEAVNAATFERIDSVLAQQPGLRVFLLTDSEPLLQAFGQRYGARLAHTASVRSASDVGVHHQRAADGSTLAEQVITDVALAARCERFIGNGGSNVSLAVRHQKDWPAGHFELIGIDMGAHRNLMLHDW
jgi:predicted O-linked N-acetylglucosamine transferase (SPINDLY family)